LDPPPVLAGSEDLASERKEAELILCVGELLGPELVVRAVYVQIMMMLGSLRNLNHQESCLAQRSIELRCLVERLLPLLQEEVALTPEVRLFGSSHKAQGWVALQIQWSEQIEALLLPLGGVLWKPMWMLQGTVAEGAEQLQHLNRKALGSS